MTPVGSTPNVLALHTQLQDCKSWGYRQRKKTSSLLTPPGFKPLDVGEDG